MVISFYQITIRLDDILTPSVTEGVSSKYVIKKIQNSMYSGIPWALGFLKIEGKQNLLLLLLLITFFAGAACRAGPDIMLILCLSVCVSEIIFRPLIGRKLAMSPDVVRRS